MTGTGRRVTDDVEQAERFVLFRPYHGEGCPICSERWVLPGVEQAEWRLLRGLRFALLLAGFFWLGVGVLVFPAPLIELVRGLVR